jgi:hypothetical protein
MVWLLACALLQFGTLPVCTGFVNAQNREMPAVVGTDAWQVWFAPMVTSSFDTMQLGSRVI